MIYELGAKIRDLRKQQNMTQKELARVLSVSEATVCKYENNTAIPPFETLRTLAVTFNVSMDELCGMSKKSSVSVHGISEEQKDIIINLVNAFRTSYNIAEKDMLLRYTLLGRISAQLMILNVIKKDY